MFIKDGIAYANVPSDEIKIITALMVYIINGLVVKKFTIKQRFIGIDFKSGTNII